MAINATGWSEFGDGGDVRPPLSTDETRWQRLVFDYPNLVTYQRMDGELVDVPADRKGDTLTLETATFTVEQPAPD